MAGHSKFKNIQHRKGAQDKKRAKVFTKLIREIVTAVKTGSSNISENNPRLRNALTAARSQNLPKERIDKAINSADDTNTENYTEIRYEGYAPNGVAIIVEALSDNKNRTAAEVRAGFSKYGGSLGETGSVNYLFKHCGVIQYPTNIASNEDIFEAAIEAGGDDIVSDEIFHTIYTDIENFSKVLEFLTDKYGIPEDSYIGWIPLNTIIIDDKEKAEKLLKLVEILEESDDVQRVFGNYELSDDVYEIIQGEQ
ncbi:YebC/PmpR family DNA-binding transcriptional regulator [Rickettsia asembonensis]|uniref:YebC/PmpR family DNA-binding transcriptional regulator n=1 Tax=Rickettsia asembonensis TaxID=1068590 RepID=UPI0023F81345|nr:YebC/PmpR family DNA-binding transcriptional regulator [Rickettsia asembonensis]WCR57415.1 MAG: putative transcriptional regulatory protein [Rickettsia asembonensis]